VGLTLDIIIIIIIIIISPELIEVHLIFEVYESPTNQLLFIFCSTFLTKGHVLNITAFRVKIYRHG
jgi:hypothetical protein